MRVHVDAGRLRVDWALVDGPFADPFFEQTADRAMRHPFNLVFARTTSAAALDAACAGAAASAPAGFVFHMSRCGSTLVAHMLAQLAPALVLSEAQPVDALLRLRRRLGAAHDELLAGWLRGLFAAFARPHGRERLFVKFHAWHVLELPFVARAFPGVPWAFVFREPRAVLRSQMREPGAEAIAGTIDPAYLGLDLETASAMPADAYAARMLAALCGSALRGTDTARGLFVEYAGLPDAVFSELLPFFGATPNADDAARARAVTAAYSKAPGDPYRPPAAGPRDLSERTDELAARWLDETYAALRAAARAR